ncbi:hypothetical protein COJ85_33130 [Bacillus sp. AFS076308]|uniref:hypothetical protein n=1 Tax=unclassified Bacillus (in: firmicutes) TaxID=185979 RepID=UPI000BF66751|nr:MULTISPECIES: hypothetical protein [unclassified Bacillus (in: firmicutes)]PFN75798.1 hypothetical protein COJ85_33130 [Bacillus sp. AFS076308]PGV55672.1 hypothetical protein COD92_01790 [Bacillus sp. AFS037270]
MYIIENANILKDKQLTTCSLFITNEQIKMVQKCTSHDRFMRMNLDPYIMTPTYVLLSSAIPYKGSFEGLKSYLTEHFLLKGCTTIFTYVELSYEKELSDKINEMKTALISSPIDFTIGVKIPPKLITPSFMRSCKKYKIPAIFVDLSDLDELERIPWGWIREAMFPFNSPLIPIISLPQKKEARMVLSKWKDIMIKEKIPSLYEVMEENDPLPISIQNKLGLYPQKGSLMTGTELSYNLYLKDREIRKVDEGSLFHYHSNRLVVTVHKGKVIRSGDKVLFSPGSGEYVKVRTPSYFSL